MRPFTIAAIAIAGLLWSADDTESQNRMASVEAAHLLAYSVQFKSDSQPVQANIEQPPTIEAGLIEDRIAGVVDSAVDRALSKAGLSWEEIRKASDNLAKVNRLFAKQSAPPATLVFVTINGPCPNCDKIKEILPALKSSGWTVGKLGDGSRIQVVDLERYDNSDPLGILGQFGVASVPKLLILRGEDVIDRGKVVSGKIETENSGAYPLDSFGIANWVNRLSVNR